MWWKYSLSVTVQWNDSVVWKKIIHHNDQDKLCWEKVEERNVFIRKLSSEKIWKNKILKQMKLKKQMTAAYADVTLITSADMTFNN